MALIIPILMNIRLFLCSLTANDPVVDSRVNIVTLIFPRPSSHGSRIGIQGEACLKAYKVYFLFTVMPFNSFGGRASVPDEVGYWRITKNLAAEGTSGSVTWRSDSEAESRRLLDREEESHSRKRCWLITNQSITS